MVVVPFVPADIDHRVDRAGAAKRLAARLISYPAIETGLRHRVEGPIVDLRRDHDCGCGGRLDDPPRTRLFRLPQPNPHHGRFRPPTRPPETHRAPPLPHHT